MKKNSQKPAGKDEGKKPARAIKIEKIKILGFTDITIDPPIIIPVDQLIRLAQSKPFPIVVLTIFLIVFLWLGCRFSLLDIPLCTLIPTKEQSPTCAIQAETDAEVILLTIQAEGQAVLEENILIIQQIFFSDAIIIEFSAGERWTNPISRYEDLFRETNYLSVLNDQIQPEQTINDQLAYYSSGSRGNYLYQGETHSWDNPPGSTHWTLEKVGECWMITRMAFNAAEEPFPP